MRTAFVETLVGLADEDDRIVLLTGDLGFRALEPFCESHPDRFFNVGVAEQDMVGLAAGLADAGFTPYCYSIATFASLRGFELFRNGAVWHRLPVRVIGIGGGFEYGTGGFTHHALEDLGIMRLLPSVTVLAPADAEQTPAVVRHAQSRPGPVYCRIGKDDHRRVEGLHGCFDPERVNIARRGDDGLVLATGAVAANAAVAVRDLAAAAHLDCTFGVVASLAPAPAVHLAEMIEAHPWVATVETHVPSGGLGALVAEVAARAGSSGPLLSCCVDDPFLTAELGSEAFLDAAHGLSAEAIHERLARFAAALG